MNHKNRKPPYSKEFFVTGIRTAFIFVGAPECWKHCQRERQNGFYNHIALPDVIEATQYRWDMLKCLDLIVIYFHDDTAQQLQTLVIELFQTGAKSVAVRYFHDPQGNVVTFQKQHCLVKAVEGQ